ncbi:MAG: alpha/beta hydrolase [Gemmatimonadota bacterium]|nr:alpha/beta hydrolase [Gemmatimonadota bacterium]
MCRWALSILGILGSQTALASAQVPAYDGTEPTAIRRYGEDPLQVGELRIPDGAGPFPVAVTIHGGCWRASLGEGSTTPAAAALAEAGIATWNIEYRRLGHEGGGWPGTFLDVGAGVDHLRVLAIEYPLDLTRVVLVGHSSGASLAVWAAGRPGLPSDSEIRGVSPLRVRAAVGIDGPMDLAGWSDAGNDARGCGGPVISSVMGGSGDTEPVRYQQASPAEMPAIDAAIFLNPAEMTLRQGAPDAMTTRARNTGETVIVRPVTNSDHYQLIDPSHEAWSAVLETIQAALGLG